MKNLLVADRALELLRETMPDGTAPTFETFRMWARPSWRRAHPRFDAPVPTARAGRRLLWDRDALIGWARRRIKRINRGGERATNR